MKSLIERCNLYFQSRIAVRTYNLQYILIGLAIAAVVGPILQSNLGVEMKGLVASFCGAALLGMATWV